MLLVNVLKQPHATLLNSKVKKNGDMELKRDQILILFNVLQDIIPYLLLTLRFGNKTLRSK